MGSKMVVLFWCFVLNACGTDAAILGGDKARMGASRNSVYLGLGTMRDDVSRSLLILFLVADFLQKQFFYQCWINTDVRSGLRCTF